MTNNKSNKKDGTYMKKEVTKMDEDRVKTSNKSTDWLDSDFTRPWNAWRPRLRARTEFRQPIILLSSTFWNTCCVRRDMGGRDLQEVQELFVPSWQRRNVQTPNFVFVHVDGEQFV